MLKGKWRHATYFLRFFSSGAYVRSFKLQACKRDHVPSSSASPGFTPWKDKCVSCFLQFKFLGRIWHLREHFSLLSFDTAASEQIVLRLATNEIAGIDVIVFVPPGSGPMSTIASYVTVSLLYVADFQLLELCSLVYCDHLGF